MWGSAVLFGSEKERALLTTIAKFEKTNDKNKKTRGRMGKNIL